MTSPRYYFASAMVAGRVLVAGGISSDTPLNTSEYFDSSAGLWKATGSMSTPRAKFMIEPLPNGDLITAGSSSKLGTTTSCEIFHPETSLWQAAQSMKTSRGAYGAAVLPDGAVMVIGGKSDSVTTASVETYSPIKYEPDKPCKPIDLVPFVEAATELPGNSSHGLIAKLIAAQAKYDSQNFSVCLNIMHAFYNQVRAFAHNGQMERTHAEAIYDGYASVLACIGGDPDPPFYDMILASVIRLVIGQ